MLKASMKIRDANPSPPEDADVPFCGLPIRVDALSEGTTGTGLTAPNANVRLRDLEGEVCRSATGAKVTMVVQNGR